MLEGPLRGENDPGPMEIFLRIRGAAVRLLETLAHLRPWSRLYSISVKGQEAEVMAGAEHPHALALRLKMVLDHFSPLHPLVAQFQFTPQISS